jgi:hypothetical protein
MRNALLIPSYLAIAIGSHDLKLSPKIEFNQRVEFALLETGAIDVIKNRVRPIIREKPAEGRAVRLPNDLWESVQAVARQLSIDDETAAFTLLLHGLAVATEFDFDPAKLGTDVLLVDLGSLEPSRKNQRGVTGGRDQIVLPTLSFCHQILCSCGKELTIRHPEFVELRESGGRPVCKDCVPVMDTAPLAAVA